MEAAAKPRYGGGRDALIDAAIRVVAREGMRGLTIRSVAAEAGVTHGLVRHHFGSRDALVEATLVRSVEMAIDSSSLAPGRGQIEEISSDLASTVESQEELLAFQYELLLEARRRPELKKHVERMYDDYTAAAQGELERAGFGNDPLAARVLFAALDGLALQQVVFGKPERTDAGVELIHALFEALLGQRAEES
ncbi:MAG: TetR family transcriptional regulator [Solirubrobacterales bacterium]|nr:TetR family transcriptional regulator [Solirubrobacterales bacterium]